MAVRCTTISSKETVFKVIFIGDEGVGKTSIISRYATSTFKTDYLPTVGANLVAKEYSFEGSVVTLIIWDIAGQEWFSKVRDKYYQGAAMVALVYDVSTRETLKNIKRWLTDMRNTVPSNIPLILVGNKVDLPGRAVKKEEGEKVAKEIHATFLETSAKTGENIRKLFDSIVGVLMSS